MIRYGSGTQICNLFSLVNDTQNAAVPKNMTIIIRRGMGIDQEPHHNLHEEKDKALM